MFAGTPPPRWTSSTILECGEGDVLRERSVRRPRDAVRLLPVPRRHSGDADGREPPRAERVDELEDLVLVEDRRHEHDRGSGVEVGLAALDGDGEVLGGVALAVEREGVGAGVEDEVDALLLGDLHDRLDLARGLGDRLQLVLDVGADDAEPDGPADRLGRVAVAALEVRGDREGGRVDDPLDLLEHQVERDLLAVGVAERRGHGVAGGRQRRGPVGGRDRPRGDHVPHVDEGEELLVLVEAQQLGALGPGLVVGGHAAIMPTAPGGRSTA